MLVNLYMVKKAESNTIKQASKSELKDADTSISTKTISSKMMTSKPTDEGLSRTKIPRTLRRR